MNCENWSILPKQPIHPELLPFPLPVSVSVFIALIQILNLCTCQAFPGSPLLLCDSNYLSMCNWVLWTGIPWIASRALSRSSSWLLILSLPSYRECAWCLCMNACLPTFSIIRPSSSGIQGGYGAPSGNHSRIHIHHCWPFLWCGDKRAGQFCLCASV